MLAARKDCHVPGVCDSRDLVSDLVNEAFLHLQPVSVFVCDACEFRQSKDVLGCDIRHRNLAFEWKQMMLAQAENRNSGADDHLIGPECLERECSFDLAWIVVDELFPQPREAIRSHLQPF